MTSIYLSTSQVAAYLSKHPYKTRNEAMLELLKKVRPDIYAAKCTEHNFVDEANLMAQVCERTPGLDSFLRESSASTRTPEAVLSNASKALSHCSEEDAQSIKKVVSSTFNTSLGINKESAVLESVRRHFDAEVEVDESLYKKLLKTTPDGTQWYLCGRVDALVPSTRTVIEIKNRVNRLFNRVLTYEKIQVQCYIYLLDFDRGCLVESHGSNMKMYEIPHSASEWKRIETGLHEFIECFSDILKEPAGQDFLFR